MFSHLLYDIMMHDREWPTIPQLYVDGEFVGGCDIMTTMHQSGDLSELLINAGAKNE